MDPLLPFRHHEPIEVAPETFLIRQLAGEGTPAPVNVYVNSLVIRGREPIIVDTGSGNNRKDWTADVFSLVDPRDVRWVFLSHDDPDHWGNLRETLELCPNAVLVTNWFSVERLSGVFNLPMHRMRWVNDGDTFDAGDRVFAAIRPPVFDSPTTRGLYDPKTGVYWSSDAFAAPVMKPVDNVAELDPEFYEQGSGYFTQLVAPWVEWVRPEKLARQVERVADLQPRVIVGGHGPAITGSNVGKALAMTLQVPNLPPPQVPGQADLEAMLQAMTNAPDQHREAA